MIIKPWHLQVGDIFVRTTTHKGRQLSSRNTVLDYEEQVSADFINYFINTDNGGITYGTDALFDSVTYDLIERKTLPKAEGTLIIITRTFHSSGCNMLAQRTGSIWKILAGSELAGNKGAGYTPASVTDAYITDWKLARFQESPYGVFSITTDLTPPSK